MFASRPEVFLLLFLFLASSAVAAAAVSISHFCHYLVYSSALHSIHLSLSLSVPCLCESCSFVRSFAVAVVFFIFAQQYGCFFPQWYREWLKRNIICKLFARLHMATKWIMRNDVTDGLHSDGFMRLHVHCAFILLFVHNERGAFYDRKNVFVSSVRVIWLFSFRTMS